MKRLLLFVAVIATMTFVGCNPQKVSTAAFYETETQFMNLEGDGSITVRAFGIGRYRGDAIDQARKNAIRDVMLKGVEVPGNPMLSKPLIMEINAEEKYAAFINNFFTDGGPYKEFFSREDRRRETSDKYWSGKQMKIAVTIRVLRPELQQYLRDNNIIK